MKTILLLLALIFPANLLAQITPLVGIEDIRYVDKLLQENQLLKQPKNDNENIWKSLNSSPKPSKYWHIHSNDRILLRFKRNNRYLTMSEAGLDCVFVSYNNKMPNKISCLKNFDKKIYTLPITLNEIDDENDSGKVIIFSIYYNHKINRKDFYEQVKYNRIKATVCVNEVKDNTKDTLSNTNENLFPIHNTDILKIVFRNDPAYQDYIRRMYMREVKLKEVTLLVDNKIVYKKNYQGSDEGNTIFEVKLHELVPLDNGKTLTVLLKSDKKLIANTFYAKIITGMPSIWVEDSNKIPENKLRDKPDSEDVYCRQNGKLRSDKFGIPEVSSSDRLVIRFFRENGNRNKSFMAMSKVGLESVSIDAGKVKILNEVSNNQELANNYTLLIPLDSLKSADCNIATVHLKYVNRPTSSQDYYMKITDIDPLVWVKDENHPLTVDLGEKKPPLSSSDELKIQFIRHDNKTKMTLSEAGLECVTIEVRGKDKISRKIHNNEKDRDILKISLDSLNLSEHGDIVTVNLVSKKSYEKKFYARYENKLDIYNKRLNGFWFPAGLFSITFSKTKKDTLGYPIGILPIGIAYGAKCYTSESNFYFGLSGMVNWSIQKQKDTNLLGFCAGCLFDINNLVYIGYAYMWSFDPTKLEPQGHSIVVGVGKDLQSILGK